MKRISLVSACLLAVGLIGFWRLTTHAQGPRRGFERRDNPPERLWVREVSQEKHLERKFEEAEAKIAYLHEAAENLERAGKHELAENLHREAEQIKQELEKALEHRRQDQGDHERILKIKFLKQKQQEIFQKVAYLSQVGRHDEAGRLRHEAEKIEAQIRELGGEREHPHPPIEPVMHELHELREEVHLLRKELQELHQFVRKNLQNRNQNTAGFEIRVEDNYGNVKEKKSEGDKISQEPVRPFGVPFKEAEPPSKKNPAKKKSNNIFPSEAFNQGPEGS